MIVNKYKNIVNILLLGLAGALLLMIFMELDRNQVPEQQVEISDQDTPVEDGDDVEYSIINLDTASDDGYIFTHGDTANFSVGDSVNLRLIGSDGSDVTERAMWSSVVEGVAELSDEPNMRGQIHLLQSGSTTIEAAYDNEVYTFPIDNIQPELLVECSSFPQDIANVGDTVVWMASYQGATTPHNQFSWEGDDGLEADTALAEMIYDTTGVKEAKFMTQDMYGNDMEATCSITIQ